MQTRLRSNSSKLTGASRDAPIDVEDGAEPGAPILREDDDDQDAINLADIPTVDETAADQDPTTNRRPKRRRQETTGARGQGQEADRSSDDGDGENNMEAIDPDSSADELSSESDAASGRPPPPKRRRGQAVDVGDRAEGDDKKKMTMDISYEGFAIYGRVLCLVVKRRDGGSSRAGSSAVSSAGRSQTGGRPGGQAMMENWIASTQAPAEDADAP